MTTSPCSIGEERFNGCMHSTGSCGRPTWLTPSTCGQQLSLPTAPGIANHHDALSSEGKAEFFVMVSPSPQRSLLVLFLLCWICLAVASPSSAFPLAQRESEQTEDSVSRGHLLIACGLPGDEEHRDRYVRCRARYVRCHSCQRSVVRALLAWGDT